MIVAGTGSRSLREDAAKFDAVSRSLAAYFKEHQIDLVISGGAEGFDSLLALYAWSRHIPYKLCLPNRGYGDYYYRRHSTTGQDQSHHFEILCERAEHIEYTMEDVYKTSALYLNGEHNNFLRNKRMVDLADRLVCAVPTSAGTRHCYEYARKKGLPIDILKEE